MKAAGWKCISSSIISIIIIALFFIGCGWNKVTRISYTPPSEKMRLTDAPTIPIAVARDFVDNRSGANKDPFLSLMWFVPYASYEYPKCYKKPSGKAMPLSKQMKLVVKKHFRTKGLFRFIAPEKIATKDTYPIFEITGVIRKISCKGGYSFCGLGIVPGLLPLLGLFSYANGGFDVDMTIECRDVLGEFISIKDISGETKKWRKNALTALGNGECTRLDLIANLISPQIEEFAKSVYEELEKRDANYWEQLIEARDAKVAEKRQTSRLAVMELKTRDVERETANSITDAIRDTLRSECESDVLSRRDMLTAIHSDEVLTDCFAADCWQDVSNKLDVQSIVLVRMEMSGKSYQLVLNLVDTETLEIEKTVTEDCVTELSLLPTARTAAKRLMIEPEPSVDEDEEDEDEEGQDEGAVEDEAEDKDD